MPSHRGSKFGGGRAWNVGRAAAAGQQLGSSRSVFCCFCFVWFVCLLFVRSSSKSQHTPSIIQIQSTSVKLNRPFNIRDQMRGVQSKTPTRESAQLPARQHVCDHNLDHKHQGISCISTVVGI